MLILSFLPPSFSLSPLHPPLLYGDWSVVKSVVPSEEEGWMKIVDCFPKQWEKQLCSLQAQRYTDTHTHMHILVVWLNFISTIFGDATHISVNHKKENFSGGSNFIYLFSHQGCISSTFSAVVRDVILHVFSILHVQVGDLGRTSGATGLSVLLSSDYFIFFLCSNWKNNIHRSFDLQDHGRKYVFEK